jgi:predicted peptidase
VLALVRHIAARFRVDRARIYLIGYSMGGAGTWDVATEEPQTFAAIAPLCGRADPSHAGPLVGMPIWVFHGQADQVVPLEYSQAMVAAVEAAGGNAKLTVYPNRGHGICEVTYENPELYDWLLAQRRAE